MIEILLEFEGRAKTLRLRSGKEKDLREEFAKMCAKDPVLKLRCATHYPTFQYKHEKFQRLVEVEAGTRLVDGQKALSLSSPLCSFA